MDRILDRLKGKSIMQEREIFARARFMYGNGRRQILHYAIIVLSIMICTSVLLATYSDDNNLLVLSIGDMSFHFDNMLIILMSGIVGFTSTMVCFLMVFIGSLVIDVSYSYVVFVYLISAVIASVAVRNGWYKKDNIKLWSLSPLLAFILGDVQLLLASLTSGAGFSMLSPMNVFIYFIGELPECVIAVSLTYLFLIKSPDKIKTLTFNGFYYEKKMAFDERMNMFRMMRSSKLSRRVAGIIIAEGVILGIGAAAFANILLPSLSQEALGSVSESEQNGFLNEDWFSADEESGESGASDKPNTHEVTEEQRFIFNRAGAAFDIKLILLIVNTAVPFIVLSNFFAQYTIVRPITMISDAIGDFCEVPQEEKEAQLMRIQALKIRNHDEIGELYGAVNRMATNITSFVDEEREKEKLAADLVIAQKTSENKSNFLSSMSHELRTPINAVLGLDEMILRESDDKDILHYANDIQNAGKSLLGLVNDILDSSKLEAGKMDIIPTQYELSSTINDLINMINVKSKEKGLELFVNVDENTPHELYGDEIRIKQVILNILTNAVKYTEEGSVTMNIGFEKKDDEHILLNVSVADTGIGIKQEDLKKLFSRFERIEEERNKNIEGTGLGMSIVKQLLALMDSELVVESEYGKGSDFSFLVEQKVINWQPIGNFTETYEKTVAGNNEYTVSFVAPDAKILVVDDTPLNLTVVRGLLKDTMVQIYTAESGAETLDLVTKYKYDIIFLDQRMPGMDGTETLHKMKELSDNKCTDTPVIVLTANAVSGSREAFLKEGFTDYISKPIDSKRLEEMVKEYLPGELVRDSFEITSESKVIIDKSDGIGTSSDKASSPLAGITAIDYDIAVANCGSEELLMSVLSDYIEAIPTKSRSISDYFEAKDYENYTILVHALKSSSRLIGAVKLSEDAAHLEELGDAAATGDSSAMDEIARLTPDMLVLYRSYYDKLLPLVSNEADDDMRPEIGEDELAEAYMAIREFAEAFDFDSADAVMESLKDYRVPDEKKEHFEAVRRTLSAVDREELLKLV